MKLHMFLDHDGCLPSFIRMIDGKSKRFFQIGFSVVKPSVAMSMVENETFGPIAMEVEEQLERVFKAVETGAVAR